MFRRHPILSVLTLLYLAAVAWITLGPQPLDTDQSTWLKALIDRISSGSHITWLTYSRVEFLANIAMFVPIGIFLVLLMGRRVWFMALLAAIALTFTIEFLQLFLPTRVPDVRDLVSNTIGACLGIGVALLLTWPAAYRDWRDARSTARVVRP